MCVCVCVCACVYACVCDLTLSGTLSAPSVCDGRWHSRCVCVCERERVCVREREKERECVCVCMCVCVTSCRLVSRPGLPFVMAYGTQCERERESERVRETVEAT